MNLPEKTQEVGGQVDKFVCICLLFPLFYGLHYFKLHVCQKLF